MRRFTISVQRAEQADIRYFDDLEVFHKECGNYRIKMEKLNDITWRLKCKRCGREIIIKNNAYGTLPIKQTAIDGETRTFNHEVAKEEVVVKE